MAGFTNRERNRAATAFTCLRYALRMEQTELIVQRLNAIENTVYQIGRGVAAVRYGTPGVFRIAIGVALGMLLYSAISLLIKWIIVALGIAAFVGVVAS